jgi:hypothetical protein
MGSLANISFLQGKLAAGIHLNVLADGKWLMHIVQLEERKGQISIVAKYSHVLSLDEAVSYVPVSIPIILSVEGKGVIHRQIIADSNTPPLLQVFPNARPEDFLVQAQHVNDNQLIVTLIRNETIVEILKAFKEKGFYLFNVFLGPFSLNGLWSLFDIPQEDYDIDFYKISITGNVISSLETVPSRFPEKDFLIGGDKILSTLLIPYANAVTFFAKVPGTLSFSNDISRLSRDEFTYKKVFRLAAAGLLGLLFFILLVNYLLFDRFNSKYIQSNLQYKSGLELVNKLENLKKELNLKEALIEENGLLANSRFSFYADNIAARVPQQIMLTSVEINPVLSKPKTDKEFNINHNHIIIEGQCMFSLMLDEWMETLGKETWVKRMEVLQYKQENKGTPGEFIIQIDF